MNKKYYFFFYCTCMVLFLTGCHWKAAGSGKKAIAAGQDITMFIATDLHYLAEGLNDKGKAFQTYLASGDGRQLNYVNEIVDAFGSELEKERPDILIISGDLTTNGEKESHLNLAEKLKYIQKSSGTQIFVIPRNHDIQNPWARGFLCGF